MEKLINNFKSNDIEFYIDEPLMKHTNYKVGGPADILVYPKSIKELQNILIEVDKTPYKFTILGRGSNILISDWGIRGVVLKLDKINSIIECKDKKNQFELFAGASMVSIAVDFAKKGLTGMEFASGIPGNIGGSIYMNAGAHGSDMEKIITEVTSITNHGEIIVRDISQINFRYRWSMYQDNNEIIISCKVKLEQDDINETRNRVKRYRSVRTSRQPYDLPSCGSVFKNPENLYSGELIELCGLKGYSIGGAQVSTKHANFIVNTGNAKSSDIYKLIKLIQEEVYKNFEIKLQPECRLINF